MTASKTRPKIAPQLVAEITQQAPDRIRRKLDRNPGTAEDWDWRTGDDSCTVKTGEQQITLTASGGAIQSAESIQCNCLLSPRCFHVLAVISLLEVDASEDSADDAEHDEGEVASLEVHSVTADQRAAIDEMTHSLSKVLAAGAFTAGSLLQADLLRAVHSCRCHGLHRLARQGLRTLQGIRDIRGDKPNTGANSKWISDALAADLLAALELSWRIHDEEMVSPESIGTARRRYERVPTLKLQGLFAEPLHTRSGYSGVVSYFLCDADHLLSISNVRPGEAGRIREVWQQGVDLGDMSIAQRKLDRQTILMQQANVSGDGRVGSGKDTRAVATASQSWFEGPAGRQFDVPVDDQIKRIFERLNHDESFRPQGWDLLFMQGQIVGTTGPTVVYAPNECSRQFLELTVQQEHPDMQFRDNLAVLAHGTGTKVRCIGRLLPGKAGCVAALALAPMEVDGEGSLQLTENLSGHINLGLEELKRQYLPHAEKHPTRFEPMSRGSEDGLIAFRRRVVALATGGRHSLPTGSLNTLKQEALGLTSQGQPTGAALLNELARASVESECDVAGGRFPADPRPLAQTWLACAFYERATRYAFQRRKWAE